MLAMFLNNHCLRRSCCCDTQSCSNPAMMRCTLSLKCNEMGRRGAWLTRVITRANLSVA
jgi:hypothetical protein